MILDLDRRMLSDGVACVYLTPRQVDFIAALADRPVVAYESLIVAIWGDAEPEGARDVLKVLACNIRRKVKAAGWHPLIGTSWGRGFVLARPVEVRRSRRPVLIPAEHRADLERLLFSHPDRAAADRVLASFAGQ